MSVKQKTKVLDEAKQLSEIAASIRKYFMNLPNITIEGTSYVPTALATKLDTDANMVAAASDAALQLKNQRKALKVAQAGIRAFIKGVHAFVVAYFGPTGQQLVDFGFTPAKIPAPRNSRMNIAAADKGARTRKILGTMGSRQRKAALAAAQGGSTSSADSSPTTTTPASPTVPVPAPAQHTTTAPPVA